MAIKFSNINLEVLDLTTNATPDIFVNQNGITGSYNTATGVLTLTGTASVANYQAALRSVTFSNATNDNPTAGGSALSRTVSFEITDGMFPSVAGTTTINVTAINDAPGGADATVSGSVGAGAAERCSRGAGTSAAENESVGLSATDSEFVGAGAPALPCSPAAPAARAGLNGYVAFRVAGGGVIGFGATGLPVDGVGFLHRRYPSVLGLGSCCLCLLR